MADDAKLNIDIGVDGAWKIDNVKRKLKSLGQEARKLSASSAIIGKNYFNTQKNLMNSSTGVWKRHFDQVDQMIKMFGKGLMKFVSFSAKFASLQVGALGLALMAVHAAFVVGQAAAKAYHAVMKLVAGGLAGLTIAAGIAAAAIREQQAAMYAYRGTNMSEFGNGINQISTQMRMMQSDAQLATVGAEGLNAALAEIYKTGTYGGGQQKMLKALMDFGAAGQDIKKGATAAGKLIATLNDPKATFSSIKEAAKAMGPAMEQALKKLNITTKEGLTKAILDGSLAAAGGVEGQFGAVSGTLINQFKGAFTQMKGQFADFGQPFLKRTKETFQEIVFIFKRGFARVMPDLVIFGQGSFFESFISAMLRMENLFVKIIREYLPATKGMFDRLSNWWNDFKLAWENIVEKLRPFIDGSRVLLDMFRAMGRELKGTGGIFTHINDLLKDNRDTVEEFGSKIGKFISVISKYGQTLREMFFDVLPFINKMIDGITLIADGLLSLMGLFRGLFGGGGFGSLMLIMGMLSGGKSMSKNVGGWIKQRELVPAQTATMNVTAGSVHVSGFTAGGQTNAAAAAGMAQRPAGGTPPSGGAAGTSGAGTGAGASPAGYAARPSGFLVPTSNPALMAAGTGGGMAGSKSSTAGAGGAAAAQARTRSDRNMLARQLVQQDPTLTNKQALSMAGVMTGSQSSTSPMHPAAKSKSQAWKTAGKMRYEGDSAAFLRTMHAAKTDPLFVPKTVVESQMKYQNYQFDEFGNMKMDPKTGLPMTKWQPFGKSKWGWTQDTKGLTQDVNPGRMKTLSGELFRKPRQSHQYKKLFGDYETGQKGRLTGGSMAMNMGASMALGMLSNVAPKEMQGALALGSTLSTINPMLGLGVGLIGGGVASGNALAGAGMGAAGGAALGMQMGGPWGAAIGAVGGALIGGIGAWWNKNKRRKQEAKKAAERIVKESTDAFYEGLQKTLTRQGASGFTSTNFQKTLETTAEPVDKLAREVDSLKAILESGGTDAAVEALKAKFEDSTSALHEYIGTQEELDRLTGNVSTGIDTLSSDLEIQEKVRDRAAERYEAVIQSLSKALGKSEEDVIKLAKETNTNLFDVRTGFDDLLQGVASGLISTQQQLYQLGADAQARVLTRLRSRQEQLASPESLDQLAAGLYEKGQTGPLAESDMLDFVSQALPLLTQYYGGDSIMAMSALTSQLGAAGQGFTQSSYFSGMLSPEVASLFQSEQGQAVMQMIQSELNTTAGRGTLDMINSAFGAIGTGFVASDPTGVQSQIMNLLSSNPEAFKALTTFLDPTKNPSVAQMSTEELQKGLADRGIGVDIKGALGGTQGGSTATLDETTLLAELGLPDDAFKKVGDALDGFAEKLNNALQVTDMSVTATKVDVTNIPADTSTPRSQRVGDTPSSRFRSTYVNHSYFDSLLTGKRTVTSGLRNFNLGSINSDHVTGRALDLAGQNLGMYKSAIEAAGGFAEFHGTNASRHLHVVPPSTPVGDSSTPVAASANSLAPISGQQGPGGQYVVNINGYNKSPQQLANEVISVMRTNERSMAERRGK